MASTNRTEYEYKGLLAETWDILRGDTSNWPDRFFYRQVIIDNGQPALDVGCGTGRLLLDYLAGGLDVDGVDLSAEMLAICREKAEKAGLSPTLHQQSMERLKLPRAYRTILVPSSSFQLITELKKAADTMKSFYGHLDPGGLLVMPFMILAPEKPEKEHDPSEWRLAAEKERPHDKTSIRRWTRARYDLVNQLEHTEDRFEISRSGRMIFSELHQRSPATRWYTQEQAVELYQNAGFADIRVVKGFTFEPASPHDTLFSVFGTRPLDG